MRTFTDESGREWVATTREEQTPRHHGRWHLVFQPADRSSVVLPMPEVCWQTAATGDRTLLTMSEFELRKRLAIVLGRAGAPPVRG
jgi:hypothetical protein